MSIVRWTDPFRELEAMRERMNRLFEELGGGLFKGVEEGRAPATWTPAVDIHETDDSVIVTAELPGVERDQVHVEVREGVLTLRGERKSERKSKGEYYHRMERSYGSFVRSFSLPATVDEDKIRATLKNGVLEIRLPKKEEARPKEIPVAA